MVIALLRMCGILPLRRGSTSLPLKDTFLILACSRMGLWALLWRIVLSGCSSSCQSIVMKRHGQLL